MKNSISSGIKAELRRLSTIKKHYETENEWMIYSDDILKTLKSYGLITNYKFIIEKNTINIETCVPKINYEIITEYTKR